MKKSVWMAQLERALSREGLSGSEKRTVLNYYNEMYQDKREDGLSEDEILKEFGFPEDVAQNVRENEYRDREGFRSRREEKRYERNDYDSRDNGNYNPFNDYNGQQSQPYQNQYSQTPPPPPPPQYQYQGQQSAPKPDRQGTVNSIFKLLGDLIRLAIVIALIFSGVGIAIGGGATVIGSFFAISYSVGAWLAALGVGIILFACGCLLFAAGIKIAKLFAPNGGVK